MSKLTQIFNSVNKYLMAAILLGVPLYPKFPFINIPGTFVSIRLEDLLILFALISVSLSLLLSRDYKKAVLSNPISKALFFYILIGFVSLFSGILVTQTVEPHIGLLHLLRRIEYFSTFFIASCVIWGNKGSENYFIKLIMIVIVVAFFYGIGQKYNNFPIIVTQNEEYSKGIALRYVDGGHINSTFAGHYDLATYLIMTLPIVAALFAISKSVFVKIFTAFTLSGGLWLLVNSASRISFLSYMVATFLALVILRKYKYAIVICVLSLAFIGTSSNLIARYSRFFEVFFVKYLSEVGVSTVYASQPPSGISRISPTPTPIPVFEDRSTNIRLAVEWPRAIRALTKNPLLGTGYSSITLATDNDYLRLLGETGILGFLSFMTILVSIVKHYLTKAINVLNSGDEVKRAFIAGYAGGFIGFLINAFFIDVFEASKIAIMFWLFTGIVYSLTNSRKTGIKN